MQRKLFALRPDEKNQNFAETTPLTCDTQYCKLRLMSTPGPTLADIDDAIAKAEWWLRLLEELAESGVVMTRELAAAVKAGSLPVHDVVDDFDTISAAVRRAIALSMQLEEALRGLNALRKCTLDEIAAAKAKAFTQTQADAAARENARAAAKARREARKEQVRELVMEVIDSEATDREDHENLTLALNQRLSFDPAYTDIDSLPLRETVLRICRDLTITPDWSRWEAGRWKPRNPVFQYPGGPSLPPDIDPPRASATRAEPGGSGTDPPRLE